MRSTFFALAFALVAPILSVSSAAAGQPGALQALVAAPARSRHAARAHRPTAAASFKKTKKTKRSSLKRRKTCQSSSSSNSTSSAAPSSSSSNSTGTVGSSQNTSTTSANSTASAATSDIDWDPTSNFLKSGNIYVGMLPDDGSGGGKKETMASLNAIMPAKAAWYGIYAQVSKGKTFDGSQLYGKLDDVKQSGAILAASVMPTTWEGLTESDNHNAVAIAKVCADIYKNHGIEVWLRFGHEMNWYQTDGTYQGGVSDFQTGWKVVAAAIEQYAPETKMWWTPNVSSDADYARYYPKEGRVDVVGFDYYPNTATENFVDKAKPFHDKYAVNGIKMVQGETGLHFSGSDSQKMQWAASLTSKQAQQELPNYLGFLHFNYNKYENGQTINFKLVDPQQNKWSGINSKFVSFFSS